MFANGSKAPSPLLSIVALLCATALNACGDSASTGASPGNGVNAQAAVEELRATGFDKYLGRQKPSRVVEDGAWTHYFFDPAEEGAVCLVGDEYQVSVHHGTSDQVLLYLQGGGACWDHRSCHLAQTALRTASGPGTSGILDLANPANPFADYDIVYAAYCDGSVFTGDATVDYEGIRTFHHGLQNLSVAIDALQNNFPDPSRLVIAGSSAGGYATYAGYGAARVALPETPILVFNDSGPGIQNADASEDVQARVANWNFTDLIPKTCTQCDDQYSYLTTWATERDDSLRTALYSYQQDSIIGFFLDLDGPSYQELLLSVTGKIVDQNPGRFARFMPKGSNHTVLMGSEFYTQTVNGTSLLAWTKAFLDEPDSWEDVVG